MASTPNFESAPRSGQLLLVPGFATRGRPVWTAPSTGSVIRQIHVASTDASANAVQFAVAKKVTDGAAMGTGQIVDGGGGSDTITRSAGSFITDGLQVGDRIQVLGATTIGNDVVAILTGVSAGVLTFATGTVQAAEAMPSTAAIYRLTNAWQVAVPALSGASAAVAVAGLNATSSPSLDSSPDRELPLGPADVLFAGVTTTLGTGETMDILAVGFDY